MTHDTSPDDTESVSSSALGALRDELPSTLHFVLLWSRLEPERVGECCPLRGKTILGRGSPDGAARESVLEFFRSRPGDPVPTGPLRASTLSRRQWNVTAREATVDVENVGKHALLHNGIVVHTVRGAVPGDTVAVQGVALFLIDSRPRVLAGSPLDAFAFGSADEDGFVGETPALWRTRRNLLEVAARDAHTLLLGASGTGKELAARALHRRSRRSGGAFVARNAATIPEGLVEAELFGNAANYPNSGMPARQGLFGLADHGTLFLDEIGELAERQQANLLRVLDAGEYQRLGDDRTRRTDTRVIGATNRPVEALKHDVLARFPERVRLPSLTERRADIPLITRALLADASRRGPSGPWEPTSALVDALVRHEFTTNVRELAMLLVLATADSKWPNLELTPAIERELHPAGRPSPSEPAREDLENALRETKTVADAAKRLGLPSRFALYRLLKKHGIEVGT